MALSYRESIRSALKRGEIPIIDISSSPHKASMWADEVFRPANQLYLHFPETSFQQHLKLFFPDGIVKSYRGVSFNNVNKKEAEEIFSKMKQFITMIVGSHEGVDYADHSLNVCESAWPFAALQVMKRPSSLAFLFIYEAPINMYVDWGVDSESGPLNEFGLHAKPGVDNYIKHIFMLSPYSAPFRKVSDDLLKFYSLNKCTRVDSLFVHQRNINIMFDDAYKEINLPEKLKWYRIK